MERGQPYIRVRLDVDQPIELSEFVGAFTAVAAEYDRFVRGAAPDRNPDATLFVKEVRAGSIEADLVPWLIAGGGGLLAAMTAANTVHEFVERYGARLAAYVKPGGRVASISKSELRDFSEQVAAIASTPGSALEIAAIQVDDGQTTVKAAFRFDTTQAREIQQRVEEHRQEIEHKSGVDHERMLMVFTRSDVRTPPVGKSTGELVKIERLSERNLPLIYASELAESAIKHEIREAEDNVFKKGFVVDVNVEMRRGKPAAYKVTNLHQVIDLPEDDD